LNGDNVNEDYRRDSLQHQILEFCRHIAGSAKIIAVSQLYNKPSAIPDEKAPLEITLVARDFQPRLMSYVKTFSGRTVIVSAVDQWIYERDVDRGFLGEALASALIFPYTGVCGEDYLHKQEIALKKRLILESLENLILSFPELSYRLHIKPHYFMYEVILNRVRIFPPLAYGLSNVLNGSANENEVESVFQGYMEALGKLEREGKIVLSNGYVTIPKKTVVESQNPKTRLTNISKNAPRTIFTSLFASFPQLINFFSQSTEAILKLKFQLKRPPDLIPRFLNPQKYLYVPTAKGLISLADRLNIDTFARKILLNGERSEIKYEPIGGVLNDLYLIRARQKDKEKKVLVKRFKDWSGFKWFPLSLWSLGARTFAVLGRSRLARECAISEFLRCEGINVPKILHVSHNERLVFMEFIEGEDLSKTIRNISLGAKKEEGAELAKIAQLGEIFAKVHSLGITLGDTKPENVIVDPNDRIYLLDFEQASHDGEKAWDLAVFLYYSGHYLQPMHSNGKATSIAKAFINGYLKGGGDLSTIKKAGASKYTRVFSVFTMPSIILAMSNVCKKTGATK
jgi:Kae1-associated kinase Bud32